MKQGTTVHQGIGITCSQLLFDNFNSLKSKYLETFQNRCTGWETKDVKTQGGNRSFCHAELLCVCTHIFLDSNLAICHLFLIKNKTKRNRVNKTLEVLIAQKGIELIGY